MPVNTVSRRFGQLDADVLEVVHPRLLDADQVVAVGDVRVDRGLVSPGHVHTIVSREILDAARDHVNNHPSCNARVARERELERRIAGIAALDLPVRRDLYRLLCGAEGEWLSREEASDALGIGRPLAAFHLDKLVHAGVLEARFERRTGRSGTPVPAGRPSSTDPCRTRCPPRSPTGTTTWPASLLAAAVAEATRDGRPGRRLPTSGAACGRRRRRRGRCPGGGVRRRRRDQQGDRGRCPHRARVRTDARSGR